MKKVNISDNVAIETILSSMLYVASFFITFIYASCTERNFYANGWLMMNIILLFILVVFATGELHRGISLAISVAALIPAILYMEGMSNMFYPAIVISETLNVIFAVLWSLKSLQKTNEANRPSKIFWRLIISMTIIDATWFAMVHGVIMPIALISSLLAVIATWIFLPENKNELKELEKINGLESALSEQKKFLPIANVIFLVTMLSLEIRAIVLALNVPLENQGEAVIQVIAILMSGVIVLAANYMINKKIDQQLDSIWSEKLNLLA